MLCEQLADWSQAVLGLDLGAVFGSQRRIRWSVTAGS
jgi:hypothetical protein